jgi:hypothetical protein
VVWLHVFLATDRAKGAEQGVPEAALAARLSLPPATLSDAVSLLLREGRVTRDAIGALSTTDLVIPVGATEGWEAAVLDHFRAVATAIATKAASGKQSAASDEVGGATLTFSLYPGHPRERAVRALLANVRAQANALWQDVSAHTAERPPADDDFKVTFYFGQMVTREDDEPPGAATVKPF